MGVWSVCRQGWVGGPRRVEMWCVRCSTYTMECDVWWLDACHGYKIGRARICFGVDDVVLFVLLHLFAISRPIVRSRFFLVFAWCLLSSLIEKCHHRFSHLGPWHFPGVPHHRSQALAGFGISGTPGRGSGQDTPHQVGGPSFPLSGPGRIKAEDGVNEGGAMHGSSVELSDLLRATRLRGGGRKGARARSPPLVSRVRTLHYSYSSPDLLFLSTWPVNRLSAQMSTWYMLLL